MIVCFLVGMGVTALIYFVGFIIQQIYDWVGYWRNGGRWWEGWKP